MDVGTLVARYPNLYHMASAGSWPSIARYGLQTTTDIVETSSLSHADQQELLTRRRGRSVSIEHPLYGDVVIRDQKPLNVANLESALIDMSVEEWLATLNSHVFFWLHPDRLDELLGARAYRGLAHDVITIDTEALLLSSSAPYVALRS